MTVAPLTREAGALRVLRCCGCRDIVGDTSSFICGQAEPGIVTLRMATGVTQGSELRTHSDGALAGCSYKALHCRSCQRLVGQRYVATPVELDALREGYSFLTESVVEYRLGSFAVTAVGREGGEEMLSAPPLLSGGGKEQPAQEGLCGRVEELQAEITRVKLVVLKLSERLGALATPSPSGRVGSLAKAPVSQAAGVSHSALFSPGAASPSPSGPRLRPLMPPPTWAKSPRASPLPGANGHARPVPQPTTSAAGSQSFPTHKGDGSAVNDNPAVNTWRQDVPHRAGVMAANAPSTSIASHAEPAGTPAQQAGPSRTADGAAGTSSPTIKPTPAAQPSLAGGKDSGKATVGGVGKKRGRSRPTSSDETSGSKRVTRSQAATVIA